MKIDLTLTTVTLCITLLHFGQDASCVPDDSGAFSGPMCKSNIIPYHFDYGRNSYPAACLNIFVYLIYIVILAPLSPHKRQNPSDQELGFLAGKSLKRQGDGGN